MYYNRKKELLKNGIIITIILLLAVISTHHIYYKFKGERDIDYNLKSLEIIYHEKSANKITLNKITPVSDAVGLSSRAYTFTVKNNLQKEIEYEILLEEDKETIQKEECGEYQIPKNLIRVAIKEENEKAQIYTMSDLTKNSLKKQILKPLRQKDYTIRVWTSNGSSLPNGSNLHYHGIIKVKEIE